MAAQSDGDVAARVAIRFDEAQESLRLIRVIVDSMPDGAGAVMIDGKMQDDATWKQAKVMVDLARQVAAKDPDYAAIYGF